MPRTLAIGDTHGCSKALEALWSLVDPQPDDLIVSMGDYIDRGPDSRGVVAWLLAWQAVGRLAPLSGNHEQMLLDVRDGVLPQAMWLGWGGADTLKSYAPDGGEGSLDDIPPEHWAFIESCLPYFETDTHIFVHANADPNLPLADTSVNVLRWNKLVDLGPHFSGKTVICGHTAQKTGVPGDLGHLICLDTWVYGEGWLTCLNVETGRYWQSNQQGETRDGQLARSV